MKRALFLCVLASGCDWAAAERQARCNAGDLTACDGGTGGGTDAGTGGGAGGGSGGGTGGGSGGGSGVDPTLGPIGLFPRGRAGALWLASNTADGGLVILLDAQGTRVAGGQGYAGRIISAYADGVSTPVFAAIVGQTNSQLQLLYEDGGANGTATAGQHVTTFFNDAGVFASVWSTAGTGYGQQIYPADLAAQPTNLGYENCEVAFHDLEVLRAGEGTRVVIAWSAAACSGLGVTVGISSGSGIQSITAEGDRSAIVSSGPRRLGRFSESGTVGFDVCVPADGGQAVFLDRFDFNRTTSLFSARPRQSIDTLGTLALGDVSGGVIVGQATDRVRLQGTIADDGGFTPGRPTVFAAAPYAGWVRALGPGIAGSNVAVLRQGSTVFVAYLADDGGTSVARLDATSGAPIP
ncbi:MAG: hypothetical protein Q8L48_42090 [Archangium sp.]|nr:hypothetical protein [Archangium sp.]